MNVPANVFEMFLKHEIPPLIIDLLDRLQIVVLKHFRMTKIDINYELLYTD